MPRSLSLLAALSLVAAPAAAQDAAVANARTLWTDITEQVTRIAEEVPDSLYGYKPVATVRSFGELFGHIAGAQYMFCAAAVGDPPRAEDAVELDV